MPLSRPAVLCWRSIDEDKEIAMMKRFYFVGCVFFAAFIVVAVHCVTAVAQDGAGADKKTIVVFAAASTTSAIDEIKQQFAKQADIDVQTSYAASAPLANQIVNGADADIFISADTKWADYLAEKKLVAQTTRRPGQPSCNCSAQRFEAGYKKACGFNS